MKTTKHRLILPMQAKGNMGKSIEAAARSCWLNQRGIAWQGFDLDGDNRTLSRLFPDQVKLLPLTGQAEDLDELISILRKTTAKPVTLVDPRAHLDGQLMKALSATHFFDIAGQQNIGITLMVFPFDDLDVMTNLDSVCLFCGKQVDYVIVRNPARAPKTRMFDGSQLEKDLFDMGAVTITVPVLSEFVKLRLAKLEAEQQRGIPFNEAIGNDALGMDIMARGVLQDWLATIFNQYDQIAAKLLPAVEAATIKPKIVPPIGEPAAVKRGAKVNLAN
ncbi:MAG: ATPase [Limisphaerales bacterium]